MTASRGRGEQRRSALVEAATGLLGEAGPTAVTARGVAARARVPLAAVTYYFDGVDSLVREAAERLAAGYLEQAAALVRDAAGRCVPGGVRASVGTTSGPVGRPWR